MQDETRDATYRELRKLLTPYAKRLSATETYRGDQAIGYYALVVKRPYGQVAILFCEHKHVRLYALPIRVYPELRELLPVSLAKRIVSRSVFVWKNGNVTADDRRGLAKLFAAMVERIEQRLRLAPKVPFQKPLNVTHVAGLLGPLVKAAKKNGASIARKGGQVEVGFAPAKRIPAELAAHVATEGRLRFKTIELAQYLAVAKLLGVKPRV